MEIPFSFHHSNKGQETEPRADLQSRRDFLLRSAVAGATIVALKSARAVQSAEKSIAVPSYLRGFESAYATDPRGAARAWFAQAKFGMFIHYGLVSLLPGGKKDPAASGSNHADLERRFTAGKFDANAIGDLALAAGMRYVCFTPYHGGGPYNFRSRVAHPNTVDDLPVHRDLVAEMADACRARGLGLFLYVHGSISQSYEAVAQPNEAIFREWLTQYGPLAGFWFDTDSAYYKDKSKYPRLAEMFALIRSLQPQALISFCHGVTGDEDYITYEHHFRPQSDFKFVPADVQKRLASRTVEICTTLQLDQKGGKGTRMWFNVDNAYHRNADEVWKILAETRRDKCNLLLNTGLLGDGSVPPIDAATLREVGKHLHDRGWPAPASTQSAAHEGEDR